MLYEADQEKGIERCRDAVTIGDRCTVAIRFHGKRGVRPTRRGQSDVRDSDRAPSATANRDRFSSGDAPRGPFRISRGVRFLRTGSVVRSARAPLVRECRNAPSFHRKRSVSLRCGSAPFTGNPVSLSDVDLRLTGRGTTPRVSPEIRCVNRHRTVVLDGCR